MKTTTVCSLLLACTMQTVQAQDLAGYQKLRGEVIASPPEDDYTTHAWNAFDTNGNTCFKAGDVPGWVGLDLKEKHIIRKIRFLPRPDRTERMDGCIFQGSNDEDFTRITPLFTVTQTPEAGDYTTCEITVNTAFRYVRCFSPEQNCNLAELEFYGDEGTQTLEYLPLTHLPAIYIETKGNFNFTDKSQYVASQVTVSDADSSRTFDASVRGRGNSTWDFMDKKSFRIKFDEKQHFLGLPANAKSWTLIACAVDKTLLRNGLAFEISRALEFEFTPACRMVDVLLDGFYFGTYMASDQIGIDKKRINIDEMEPGDTGETTITGGYHLEIDAYADLEPLHFRTPRGLLFTIQSPENDVPAQYEWIENHIAQTEDALFLDTDTALEKYIDLESAVKYYIHSELTGNCDSYWCIPCYKKRGDDKLYFGPVWDYDQAFLTNYRVPLYTETLSTQHGVAQFWFRQIMATPQAEQLLFAKWKELKNSNLKQRLLDYLDENAALLQQSQELNYRRWNSINRRVWFEDALFDTYGEYIDFVKRFIEDRFAWFDDMATERKAILPASTPGRPPHTWKYTFDTPDGEWYTSWFDDGNWQPGDAPFGNEQDWQNTEWNTGQIFIRTQFFVNEGSLDRMKSALFYVWHDEDCDVYLNGEPALHREGYLTQYQYFGFDQNLLQEGWNTLAVQCTQTVGGQLIDVGIYITEEEELTVGTENPCGTLPRYLWAIKNGVLRITPAEPGAPAGFSAALYGIDGKRLRLRQASGGEIQFPLSARGIYFVRLPETTIKIIY